MDKQIYAITTYENNRVLNAYILFTSNPVELQNIMKLLYMEHEIYKFYRVDVQFEGNRTKTYYDTIANIIGILGHSVSVA